MSVAEKPSAERELRDLRELRWERRPDERPREILDAALRVFAEKGYHRARLAEVAEAAGVTKGTVYHYFSSKEDVLRQAVAQAHARLFGRLEEMLRRSGGSAESRIRLLVRQGFTPGDQPSESVLALLVQGLAHEVPEVYREWLLTGPVKGWQLVARLIEEGQASGEFRADADAEVAARLLTSGLMQQLNWMRPDCLGCQASIDRERLVEAALELVLRGLRPAA